MITTSPIINSNNNRNSSNIKVIKAIAGKSNSNKTPIIINSIKKIGSINQATTTTAQLPGSCQPVQILLTRKIGGGLTTINTNNNQHNPLIHNTILTSTKPGGVIQKHSTTDSIIIKEISSESDLENNDSGGSGSIPTTSNAAVTTEEIMKKFRIPKGIALTPKFANDLTTDDAHMHTDNITQMSTTLMSPPLTSNDDADNSSALVEYVEEIYDEEEEEEPEEEEVEEMHAEELEEIDESCEMQDYQETHIQDEEEEEEIEENDLIEEVESSEHQDLLMSGESDEFLEASNNTSNILQTSGSATVTPQIIQAVQPNGTVTCFQLPPNTILLQSPDGALLATTAPHPTKPGQQQIIAIQDLNSQLSELLNLSSVSTPAPPPPLPAPTQPTTVILTADGTAIPLVTPTTTTGSSSSNSNIAQHSANAGVITSNESLMKAQQQQILA